MILLWAVACGHPAAVGQRPVGSRDPYDNSLFELASAFAAKETCSCRFVQGRTAEDCAEWVRVSPDVAKVRVDEAARVVVGHALGMGEAVARYEPGWGCVLDP